MKILRAELEDRAKVKAEVWINQLMVGAEIKRLKKIEK